MADEVISLLGTTSEEESAGGSHGTLVPRQLVLVLVGLPGAGKSTLFRDLDKSHPGHFCRVCQDCLKTKPKCEAAARDALARGFSPVIDRTNVDAKQREPWLKIAAQAGVPAWSVFLRVEPKLCMQRVAARIEHETNPKPFVVNMLKGRLRAPHTDEGFGQTLVAATPAEVSSLIERLGSSDGSRADEDDSVAPSLERPAKRVRATAGVATRTPAQSRLSLYRGDLFGNEILLRGASQGGRAAVAALTALCHCVSRDLAMGKGIAAEFKRRYGGVAELRRQQVSVGGVGYLAHTELSGSGRRYIYYLVTKERYWHKPTMEALRAALTTLRALTQKHGVQRLAMPKIGCGLDRLSWEGATGVRELLLDVFEGTGLDITVCVV